MNVRVKVLTDHIWPLTLVLSPITLDYQLIGYDYSFSRDFPRRGFPGILPNIQSRIPSKLSRNSQDIFFKLKFN